jgi:hypothetical protein
VILPIIVIIGVYGNPPFIQRIQRSCQRFAVQWTAFKRWKVGTFKRWLLFNGNRGVAVRRNL